MPRRRVERLDDVRDAVVDAEPGIGTAEFGLHPAGGHQDQAPAFAAVTCRVTAHERVQGGLAAAVHLVAAALVVGHAALARGHHPDGPCWFDVVMERLDDSQRAQRVGDHDPDELVGRRLGHRSLGLVRDAGVDEEQVEHPVRQTIVQRGDLCRHGDVDALDLDLSGVAIGEVMKTRPVRAAHGGGDVPTTARPLLCQRQPETARGADEEYPSERRPGWRLAGTNGCRHANSYMAYNCSRQPEASGRGREDQLRHTNTKAWEVVSWSSSLLRSAVACTTNPSLSRRPETSLSPCR